MSLSLLALWLLVLTILIVDVRSAQIWMENNGYGILAPKSPPNTFRNRLPQVIGQSHIPHRNHRINQFLLLCARPKLFHSEFQNCRNYSIRSSKIVNMPSIPLRFGDLDGESNRTLNPSLRYVNQLATRRQDAESWANVHPLFPRFSRREYAVL
jgi:hypothetical protein